MSRMLVPLALIGMAFSPSYKLIKCQPKRDWEKRKAKRPNVKKARRMSKK